MVGSGGVHGGMFAKQKNLPTIIAFIVTIAIYPGRGEGRFKESADPTHKFMGVEFVMHTDALASDLDLEVLALDDEPIWSRPAVLALPEDCLSLSSVSHPVVLNTHSRLFQAGHIAHLPYLFREHCTSAGSTGASSLHPLRLPWSVALRRRFLPCLQRGILRGEKSMVSSLLSCWWCPCLTHACRSKDQD